MPVVVGDDIPVVVGVVLAETEVLGPHAPMARVRARARARRRMW
jgi:hypothetical protein